MKLFIELIVFFCGLVSVRTQQSFLYEKLNNYAIGKRIIPNLRKAYEYPEPLPSTKLPAMAMMRDPFAKLYQGVRRRPLDVRVIKKDFYYPATAVGHKMVCESLVNCKITHVSIETDDGIPIILRGGVGYYHFSIVVRAKPGDPLQGSIKIYCNKTDGEAAVQNID